MQNFEPVEDGNIGTGQYMRVIKFAAVYFRTLVAAQRPRLHEFTDRLSRHAG